MIEYFVTGYDDLENNIDAVIEGCDFGNAETHLEFSGRQVTVKHNTFGGGHNAMLFKQFNTLGKYGGSARGYRIWNNFKGVRKIVHISAKKYSVWHIYLNNDYVGSIQYDPFTKKFHHYLHDNTLLTEEHIQKYITMIEHGQISWRKGEGR